MSFDPSGPTQPANSIIIYGGANMQITPQIIDRTMDFFDADDYILLQNEISCVDYAIRIAKERGLKNAEQLRLLWLSW